MVTRRMMRRMLDEISEENCSLCEEIAYIKEVHEKERIFSDEQINKLRTELTKALSEKNSLLHENQQLRDLIKSNEEKKKETKPTRTRKQRKSKKQEGSYTWETDWLPTCKLDDIIAAFKDYCDSNTCY